LGALSLDRLLVPVEKFGREDDVKPRLRAQEEHLGSAA
jgi:hypothetical protein